MALRTTKLQLSDIKKTVFVLAIKSVLDSGVVRYDAVETRIALARACYLDSRALFG